MTDYPYTFFVLKGLVNGEAERPATRSGPPGSPGNTLSEGWYFQPSDDAVEAEGPFKNVEEVRHAVNRYRKVRKPGLRLLGHVFYPMTQEDWQGFAGAEPGTLICHLEHAILLWCPVSETVTEVLSNPDDAITEHGEENRVWRFEVV